MPMLINLNWAYRGVEGVDLHEGLMEVSHESVVRGEVPRQALLLQLARQEHGFVEEAVVEVALRGMRGK